MKLGYSPVTKPLWWDGKTHRVWLSSEHYDSDLACKTEWVKDRLEATKLLVDMDFLS
jgi:hypothetical protein